MPVSGASTQAPNSSEALLPTPHKSPRKPPNEWAWRSLTESTAGAVPPIFTRDGSYFFTASGSTVKIHSASSGQVISTLTSVNSASKPSSATGYGEAVTSMVLSPHNPFQLLTASMDGCVRLWDFVDAVLLQTIEVSRPILQIAAHERYKNEVCIAISRGTKKLNNRRNPTAEDNAQVQIISTIPTESTRKLPVQKPSSVRVVGKARYTYGLSYSPSGDWLVAIGGHKAYICRVSDVKAGFTKLVSPEKLTCLAFHPTDDYFATGDNKGVVRLWYCLNDSIPAGVTGVEKKAPTTTLHWHAHAISSLAFTANGAYLLSGGEEAVLVIWQLHTGKREFVPRVGAPIASITLSTARGREEEYMLGLSDASYIFVRSGTLRISRTIVKVKLGGLFAMYCHPVVCLSAFSDPAIVSDRPPTGASVPLAAHAISSSFILPSSHPSSLQTYSPLTSTLISELEVSPTNKISRRDEKPLEPSRVEHAVTSESGQWLATVDSRPALDGFRGEIYIKLWSWDKKKGSWMLNTRIDRPHGLSKVTTVTFRPGDGGCTEQTLVTAGADGCVKMWGVCSTKSKSGEVENFWVTRATVRSRSETPTRVAWSRDGSLMAVASGPYVTLYDPSTMLAVRIIICPECEFVSSVCFVGRTSRYLALRSHSDIALWDLITESVRWNYQSTSGISELFPHHRDESFVIFETDARTPQTHVLKFSTASSEAISAHTLPFRLISTSPCPPRWLSNDPGAFAFVGITQSWNAVIFGDHIRLAGTEEATGRGLVGAAPVTTQTLFQDIFGKSAFENLAARNANVELPSTYTGSSWKGKEVERTFDTPTYLVPPLGTLFDLLLDEFLAVRTETESTPKQDAQQDVDQEADVEMEGVEPLILVGNQLERVVDHHEMTAMIELFKNHSLCSSSPASVAPTPKKMAQTNGPPKANGVPNGTANSVLNGVKPNGLAPKTSLQNLDNAASEAASPKHVTSPPAKAGQKRKQSLD
ncbi:uncharacterized protein PHACADRAFT_180447 [Phanerochaete carnosa HHB-10118-sp]|uniref:WD repeat-containing protein 75 second beta-propeller domain-containing protein n=1 Tax=Phanerochaete carnosa (strain HHB-10118-sp) TaxID=650164 RepID=K5XE61_PHACS|nr:uncharacterized protein PHACADRAFT_180447 [Phanerochaete carnosa HHB-10118-sp]EKM61312.1 hypothetical protein PHACADRAFT_180447 [Phanerochaete carnosa HHB-10118-sp]